MAKKPTTIRLDTRLHKEVVRRARKEGLNFSGVVHLLLLAFTQGDLQIGVTQYPKKYIEAIEKESEELSRRYRQGRVKGYGSAKELFDDILDR
jgi:hypothetical protein